MWKEYQKQFEQLRSSPNTVEIPRISGVDKDQFREEFLSGPGRPAVVTDAMDTWGAPGKWTFDFFREKYGDDDVVANSPFFLEDISGLSPVQVELKMRDYVDHLKDPEAPVKGSFVKGSQEELDGNGIPLYAPCYRVLSLHPELHADVSPSPYFMTDWIHSMPESFKRLLEHHLQPIHFLFMSARGAIAFLHQDYWASHAYLAQLQGKKLAVLFSPTDSANIYEGKIKNPLQVDLEEFPLFEQATPHIAELNAGETLFFPSLWWHFVVCVEPSITFSYDFVNEENSELYFASCFELMLKLISAPSKARSDFFLETFSNLFKEAQRERERLEEEKKDAR